MRGGTLNPKSFVKTQVQISSKVGQMKKVDKGLKDAITSLKKPNCIVGAADIVEDSKKRLTTGSIRSITPLTLKDIPPANLPRGPRSVPRIHWQMSKSWRPRKVEGQQNLNRTFHLYSRMRVVPYHYRVTYPKSKIPKHNSRLQVRRSAPYKSSG